MEIFPFLCLFIGIIHCDNVHPEHPECWLQCGLKDIIATITCTKQGEEDSATTECNCQNNAKPEMTCSDLMVGDEPFNHLQNWTDCQELAQHGNTVDDWHNNYFRWENSPSDLTTICYFLDTCEDKDSLLPPNCVPYEGAPCVAGVTDSCDPDPEYSCPPATWSDDGLHWTCRRHGTQISAYGSENLPGETQCFTTECKYWEWSDGQHEGKKEAKVKCVKSGKWGTGAESGTWESFDQDGRHLKSTDPAEDIFPDQNDAPCHCGRLQTIPANMENPGLNLFCEKPLTEENGIEYIEYGNTCTLLCDGHFVMYIECYLGAWQNTAKYPFEIIDDDGDQIKC